MLLAELVATSDVVASTAGRSAKIRHLAALLARLESGEAAPAVAMLCGAPRQGRIGVGWRTLQELGVEPAHEPVLSVGDVDQAVESLVSCTGPGSAGRRRHLLSWVMARATEAEQAFVRGLLTGELRQGALDGVMAEAVAQATAVPAVVVRRAAMLNGNLAATAAIALADGRAGLEAIRMRVGRAVQPMLAATSPDVAAALAEVGEASVEWKLDGARVQVHRCADEVAIFTRSLNDVTSRLPDIVAAARSMPGRSFVLDGEAVGFDPDDRPEVFQDTMSRFGRQVEHGTGPGLAARFFDVLHLDGRDLLDDPLVARLEVLDSLVGALAVPRIITADAVAAEEFAASALDAGHEGVMVKSTASTYEAGRRGRNWRKVKPVWTLDLVVLAVEWGSGRRRGWLSNLHLGALDPSTGGFVMVGKTFKGLTDELLRWQTEQFLARTVAEHGHVVEVRPELVVEIAVDGVQTSTRYPGGAALRFARVRRYRPDKAPSEADTIESVCSMRRGRG